MNLGKLVEGREDKQYHMSLNQLFFIKKKLHNPLNQNF